MWSGIPYLDAAEAAKMQKECPDMVKLVEKPETCGQLACLCDEQRVLGGSFLASHEFMSSQIGSYGLRYGFILKR